MLKKLRLKMAKFLLPKEYEIDKRLDLTHDYYMLRYESSLKVLREMKQMMDSHYGEDWREPLYTFVKNDIEEIEGKKQELQAEYQLQNTK